MADIQLNPTQIALYGAAWGALCAVIGWFANYRVAVFRERQTRKYALEDAREERKRNFRGFMEGFRSWVERADLLDLGDNFNDRVHPFRAEAARIRQDVPEDKRSRFDECIETLCRLTPSEVVRYEIQGDDVNYLGRHRLCTEIDQVVKTLD